MIFFLLACDPDSIKTPDDNKSTDALDSGDSSDSATTAGFPWEQDGFWDNPGPMEHRLLPDSVDAGGWAVRMATSKDGLKWTADPRVIAYGFSSLDLLVTDSGVIVSGVVSFIENDSVLMQQPSIISLVSPDLEHWGSVRFGIGDATRKWVIDPDLRLDERGFTAVWYGTDEEGDPAHFEGQHEVYSATWGAGGFTEDRMIFSSEWLADPSFCSLGGQSWLWYTWSSQEIRAAKENDGIFQYQNLRYEQLNVPSCQDGDSLLTVWAQGGNGAGSPWKMDVAVDGSSARTTLYDGDLFGQGNCTSPEVGFFGGKYVLFCAVQVVHP